MGVPPPSRFDAAMTEHFSDVWSFVRRRVSNASDGDDITADVFAVAWRRLAELPLPPEDRLWLFGVARRVLANHRRSTTRRARLHLRLIATSTTPEYANGDCDDAVWHALAALDPDDRDLIMMRAWDGLAIREIAVVLGASPNAVSQRYAAAKRRLSKQLDRIATTHSVTGGHVVSDPTSDRQPTRVALRKD